MDSEEEQAVAVGQLVSLGFDANMVRFETGTVFKEGESGTEHMVFGYGGRIQYPKVERKKFVDAAWHRVCKNTKADLK